MSSPSLCQQIGEPTIAAVLDRLYERLFSDPMVGFLFDGHDRQHIVRMQTLFTRRLLGDTSAEYTGKSIPDAHASLPILPGHFDRRHRLLAETLEASGLPPHLRDAWLRLDRSLRTAVLHAGQHRIDELRSPEAPPGEDGS